MSSAGSSSRFEHLPPVGLPLLSGAVGPTRLLLAAAIALACVRPARADDATRVTRSAHAVYVEGLGRGGLWGLGYSYALHPRWSIGAVGSFTLVDDQQVWSISPYVTRYLAGEHRHRWFVDVGPQVVHTKTPSPVPEWMGTSSTGVGAHVASGYELRAHVLVRAFVMTVVGKHGPAPWFGADVGWSF